MSERKKIVVTAVVASVITFFSTLIVVWGVFTATTVANYKDLGNLVEVMKYIRSEGLYKVDTKTLVDGSIKGMVGSLNDPYSVYMEPKSYKDLNEKLQGGFVGVGIYVESKENKLLVFSLVPGSPAEKSGIKPGDVITKIDDKDTTGMDIETAAGLIRGQEGSKVKLIILRPENKKVLEYVLTRKKIEVPSVMGEMIKDTKIAQIKLNGFNSKTSQELKDTINNLKKKDMQAIILDLRDNPGGELEASTQVANYFVPKGPITFIVNSHNDVMKEYDSDGNNLKLPLVVLVNEGSASASEIVSGAIKDTESVTGAVLVGTKTFGKGVVQTIYELKGGAGLKLTTARYLTPKKNDINKKGITPDVVIQRPDNTDGDIQLDKAVDILKKKL